MTKTEKRKGKKPTVRKGQFLLRQKRLAKLLIEDRGKTPIGKLIKEAGYSKAYSTNPQQLRKTLSWQELMEKNLPDHLLSKRHGELVGAMMIDHYIFPNSMSDEEIKGVFDQAPGCKLITIKRNAAWARAFFSAPDNISRNKAIELAYKIKDKFPAEKHKVEATVETVEIVKYGEPSKKENKASV